MNLPAIYLCLNYLYEVQQLIRLTKTLQQQKSTNHCGIP
uniref:Uncharacterized protein n=1 Tax=Tetraselmis sp. GSL018 TaxID=582737 RepID=A0A061S0M2_9CHLO